MVRLSLEPVGSTENQALRMFRLPSGKEVERLMERYLDRIHWTERDPRGSTFAGSFENSRQHVGDATYDSPDWSPGQ